VARPRSESARRAVLDATVELVERDGYAAVTMEGIARHAGVGKQTVYRWWPSKAVIVLEALNEGAAVIAPAEADPRAFLRRTVRGAQRNRHLLAALMAEAQLDEAFARSFREEFLARRRAVLEDILRAADAPDPAFGADLVFSMLWYRILVGHRPLDRRFADQLAEAATGPSRSRPPRGTAARRGRS
jgi:AcrR family transcriptional regulator